jgi:class 3 adenylate cyclase
MPPTIADFHAAGLYDPAAPDAANRLALLEWLVERGATIEQMVRAARTGTLLDVAGELGRTPGRRLTLAEAAALTGMSEERIEAIRFAVGLPRAGADEPVVGEEEARSFEVFTYGEELFGPAGIRRFTQVIGTSLARVAEAAMSLSMANLLGPIRERGGDERALAEARFRAAQSVGPLSEAVAHLYRAHMAVAARRIGAAQQQGALNVMPMAVGFLDLVGFTTLARQVDARGLAAVIDRFEETAHDVTTAGDGRVVKFIGDEVMFVTRDPAAACGIALTLVERFAGDAAVTPRGAIAAGDVLVRGGDYYGPVVNLAARAAELAVPREILVTESVASLAPAALRFEVAGRRTLKGFDEPVRLFTVERGT